MRPTRLDLDGFGTYAEPTTVDFTDADFFAFTGPTGAGKSTILDAICFALYGKAPRWGGNSVRFALAPSRSEGKVRLVFSADGDFYVATRVVKRDAKGEVKTASAALERLPDGFSVAELDELAERLGTVLAGSASAMSAHIESIVGLPYDQFTKCVLLPQGAFAEFLHAKSADRRKILENLLGYSVYRQIQSAARTEQKRAQAVLDHVEHQLASLPQVTDEMIAGARDRIGRLADLMQTSRKQTGELDDATGRLARAREALAQIDAEIALLTYIKQPADVTDLADELAGAERRVSGARDAVEAAEQSEEELRAAIADTDLAALERLLAAHDEHEALTARLARGTEFLDKAGAEHDRATAAAEAVAARLAEAEERLARARTADLAADLRDHLHVGQPCPVCEQEVERLPTGSPAAAITAAESECRTLRQNWHQAAEEAKNAEVTLRSGQERFGELAEELQRLTATLDRAADLDELQARRDRAQQQQSKLAGATAAVKAARAGLRRADEARRSIADRLTTAWQEFDHHRDRVARLGPPAASRTDLAGDWQSLVDWAADELDERRERHHEHSTRLADMAASEAAIRSKLTAELGDHGVAVGAGATGADFLAAISAAHTAAEADQKQLVQQRAQLVDAAAQRADYAHRVVVAKELAKHLQSSNFMEWLLSEALGELVAGATDILRQLSGGQYDLDYQEGEFWVVDHHDADLPRPVRTLSGGETFTASLALALAMSEQLAGMSESGACLESILLDEGFGTLDAATLDGVAATLETLASSGDRMVGIVTHVADLAERVPVRYEIGKDARGSHVTRLEG